MQEACRRERRAGSDLVLWVHALLSSPVSSIERRRSENAIEEFQKTRERRRTQQPYEGEDRRKRVSVEQPVDNADSPGLPVSGEDGTGRR
jgi:hypothetical protein